MEAEIARVCRFFERIDRMISGRKGILVKTANLYYIPGFTNGTTITLSKDMVKNFLIHRNLNEFIILKGVNYHELAHCLFTGKPKFSNYKVKKIFNILEDGRIETLFSLIYPKAREYFKFAFLSLVNLGRSPIGDFLMVYSRRMVLNSPSLLKKVEKEVVWEVGKEDLKKLKELIDRFLVEWDVGRRLTIAEEVYFIISKNTYNLSKLPEVAGSTSSSPRVGEMKKLSKKLKEKLKEFDKQLQSSSERRDGEKKGGESKSEDYEKNKDLKEIANEEKDKAVEEVYGEALKEASSLIRARRMYGMKGSRLKTLGEGRRPLSTQAKIFSHKLYVELKHIKQQEDYGWREKERAGKLNLRMMRKLIGNDVRIFKKWKIGDVGKMKVDVVALVDVSGSMARYERMLRDMLIGLGEAIERVNLGKLAMAVFSDYYAIVKRMNEKGRNDMAAYGLASAGTTAGPCVREFAFKQFMRYSTAKRKYLLIFTDGMFWDYDAVKVGVNELNRMGVKTIFILPKKDGYEYKVTKERFGSIARIEAVEDYDYVKLAKKLRKLLEEVKPNG